MFEEQRAGGLMRPGLRHLLEFETRPELDGFLEAHGINEGITLAELERDQQTLPRLVFRHVRVVVADAGSLNYLC